MPPVTLVSPRGDVLRDVDSVAALDAYIRNRGWTPQAGTYADAYQTLTGQPYAPAAARDSTDPGLPLTAPAQFGAAGDGVTDDTAAVQAAIDSLATRGGTVVLGAHRLTTDVIITRPDVTLRGGHLTGRGITIRAPAPADLNFAIDAVTIDLETIVPGRHGITLDNARQGRITGTIIRNFDHAIHVVPTAVAQSIRRVLITGCHLLTGTTGLHVGQVTPTTFTVGDLHLTDTQMSAVNTAVLGRGVDGLLVRGCTIFQRQATTPGRCFDLDYANWINIEGNNIFEAGLEGIRVARFDNLVVFNNSLAWTGQLTASSGILLEGGDLDGAPDSNATITGNNIIYPSRHGIEVLPPCDRLSIMGNNIADPGHTTLFRGPDDLTATVHYGIATPAAAVRTVVTGNVTTGRTNQLLNAGAITGNMDQNGLVQRYAKLLTLTAAETSVDATAGPERVTCNQPAPQNVTITPGYNGQQILFHAVTSNTTLVHSTGLMLRGAVNATIPAGGTLTVYYTAGHWTEMARNF